eukprot:COSAG01_NODE_9222_length_2514_cov_1.659213_4_plen_56_part_00
MAYTQLVRAFALLAPPAIRPAAAHSAQPGAVWHGCAPRGGLLVAATGWLGHARCS